MNERINYIPGILIELLATTAISPLGIVDVVDYILPNGDIVTELELGSSNAYSKSR